MAVITSQVKLTPTITGSLPSGSEGCIVYDSTDNALKCDNGVAGYVQAGGKVLQVKQQLTGDYSCTSGWGGASISVLTYCNRSVSITPLSTTSKIYGQGIIACGSDIAHTASPQHYYNILRSNNNNNSDTQVDTHGGIYTMIYMGRTASLRFDDYWNFPINLYDSAHGEGSGSAVTYRLYYKQPGSYPNRGSGFDLTMWEIET